MRGILSSYALVLFLAHGVWSQGSARLTFSSNPTYIGDQVTLTCDYGSYVQLKSVTIDAFNGTLKTGSLYCQLLTANSVNGSGVFNGKTLTGCPDVFSGVTSVSVALTATPEYELDYNCTVKVLDGDNFINWATGPNSLKVRVCPSSPSFQLNPVAFNDSDNGTIMCVSPHGKPAALVSLTVTKSTGATLSTLNSSDSAVLVLPSPMSDWHNTTVTCRVVNHICPNMIVTSNVRINYLSMHGRPDLVHSNESDIVLNCSAYFAGYPMVRYSWTVPPEANATNEGSLSGPTFVVLKGQSGVFNCTATNDVTTRSLMIAFSVSNIVAIITPFSATTATYTEFTTSSAAYVGLISGLLTGIILIVVITIIVVVLCKRRRFTKMNKPQVASNDTDKRSRDVSHHGAFMLEACNVTCDSQDAVDRAYDSLDTHKSSEPCYAQLVLEGNSRSETYYENFNKPALHCDPSK